MNLPPPLAPAPREMDLLHAYRQMVSIREFEQRVLDLFARTLIPGIAHVSIGQEAVAVGICSALRQEDYITSTHRGHGHCLAKGAAPDRMFAELFGRLDGYCRGKGGSMHIADPATGNLGANAIVGGSLAIATGAGLTAKRRGRGQVAVCFFGDGALNQGQFLEAMNMAAIWRLPVLYVCENNQYGEYTAADAVTSGDPAARGRALGIPAETVDGMDVQQVYAAGVDAVARARRGEGPSLLIGMTYRYFGHGMGDRERAYRTRAEEEEWRRRDPLERLARQLVDAQLATVEELAACRADVAYLMDAAVAFGLASPLPSAEEVFQHVYSD